MKSYISTIDKNDYSTVVLNVQIDMDNGPVVQKDILNFYENSQRNIAIDLSNSQFIFSAGMGLLIRINELTRVNDHQLFLINVTSKVFEALESLGLTKIIKTFKSELELIEFIANKKG